MRKIENWCWILGASVTMAGVAGWAQTRVDLQNQGKGIDFTQAPSTKPVKTGTVLPATCVTGELFLLTGLNIENLYACAATNTWVAQGYLLPSQTGASGKVLSSNGSSEHWSSMGGDVTGAITSLTVGGLQNRPVSATAPAGGQTLMWNGSSWIPQTITVGQGSLTIESNGTTIGTRSAENFINGLGLITAISDDGTKLSLQQSVDTAVLETKANAQAGTALYCASASGSASAYTCALNPTLTAYTPGMLLRWKPDINAAGGAATLDVDTLGAKAVKLADGVTDPAAGDVLAGNLYDLWFDGVNFRLKHPSGISAVLETKSNAQAGAALYCASASGSASAYTCALNPTLTAYTPGMLLRWKPDINAAGGAATLDVDTLGAKAVKLADGVTDPAPGDVLAGNLYGLWFDGVNFRMKNPAGTVSSGVAQPVCEASLRGRIWNLQGAVGVKDEVAVCAKDATDSYAWRVLY